MNHGTASFWSFNDEASCHEAKRCIRQYKESVFPQDGQHNRSHESIIISVLPVNDDTQEHRTAREGEKQEQGIGQVINGIEGGKDNRSSLKS